jgi:hypothetical protein
VGLDGNLAFYLIVDYVVPTMLLFVLLWKYAKSRTFFAIIPLITASDISKRINEVVRNIILQIFEIAQPVLTVLGVAQILLGLLLAMGFRQEFLGYRLVIGGIITLIFTYVIAPMLLSFI